MTESTDMAITLITIFVTLIVGVATPLATVYGVKKQTSEAQAVHDTKVDDAIADVRKDISRLEQKQDKYNHLQERTFYLEKAIEIIEERIKVANHRIDDLEGNHNERK